MTDADRKTIIDLFYDLQHRMTNIETKLDNRLKVAMVLDVSDDKVHVRKQIVNVFQVTEGVVIQIV